MTGLGTGMRVQCSGPDLVLDPPADLWRLGYDVLVQPFRAPGVQFEVRSRTVPSTRGLWAVEWSSRRWVLADEDGPNRTWDLDSVTDVVEGAVAGLVARPRSPDAVLTAFVAGAARFALQCHVRALAESWPELLSYEDVLETWREMLVEDVMDS